jgi:hypothetical protein
MVLSGGAESGMVHCGREVTASEVELIRQMVELFPNLRRNELAATVCEHMGWRAATGRSKLTACLRLLERLEAEGLVTLPEKRGYRTFRARGPVRSARTDPRAEVAVSLTELGTVRLEVVPARSEDEAMWNEYVARYHYLGYRKPFGCPLRYFAHSERGVLGCMLFAGAAKAITVRDEWIGWTAEQRLRNLPWVVNNTRFLILPWVRVRHLASHVLGMVARQVVDDWSDRWGYRPLLMETFVDPARFSGTCYRAAGWLELGRTTGEGLVRRGSTYSTTPKLVLVRPLDRGFRAKLCGDQLQGVVGE